jgi:hypothetical protein
VAYLNVVERLVSVPCDNAAGAEQVGIHAFGAPMADTNVSATVATASAG